MPFSFSCRMVVRESTVFRAKRLTDLVTMYNYVKHLNPDADVRLFGQELMGQTYAIGLAEVLIKGQDADNFVSVKSVPVCMTSGPRRSTATVCQGILW